MTDNGISDMLQADKLRSEHRCSGRFCFLGSRMPSVSQRIRGRRAVDLRRRRLQAEPLCRDCLAKGRWTASTVPDHIVPLDKGGIEDGLVVSPNIRCLCADCHAKRTAEQFGYRAPRKRIGVDGWPVED